MPKINTGFSKFHYRVNGWNSSIRPKPLPGGIKINMQPSSQERKVTMRTDKGLLMTQTFLRPEAGRTGTLEVVSLPESFLTDVLGWYRNSENGPLIEGPYSEIHLELKYETDNGGNPMRFVIYDVVFSRPNFDASTLSASPNANTRSLEFTVNPNEIGEYQARASQGDTGYDTWFD